ncbi:hypothetical protein [Amycolatopsis australiensis]|uniref:Uncharacterized protein n=1 Tax=Amycolatopsis australiensis TaxID=546364 RepID=A0A1K1SHL4_9PSEU|nr:hypothetical protein [Amycolatopsis australiensis]SFW83806.1 hypothetical protein SAMN04489730_5725 [Amycolatopsis australiensis]
MIKKPDLARAVLCSVSGGVLTAVVSVLGATDAHAEPKDTAGRPSPPPVKQRGHDNTSSANAAEHAQETAGKKRQASAAGSERAAERRRETAERKAAEATKEGAKKPSGSANAAERRRESTDRREKQNRWKASQAARGEQRERRARQDRRENASKEDKQQAGPARMPKEQAGRQVRRPSRSTASAEHELKGAGRKNSPGNGKLHLRLASGSSRDPDGDYELCALGDESCDKVESSDGPGSHDMSKLAEKPLKIVRNGAVGGLPLSGGGAGASARPPARGNPPAPPKTEPRKPATRTEAPSAGPSGPKGQAGTGPATGSTAPGRRQQTAPAQPRRGKGAAVRPTPATETPTLPRGSGPRRSAGTERPDGAAPPRPATHRAEGSGGRKSADETEDKTGRKPTARTRNQNAGKSGDRGGGRDSATILEARRKAYEKQEKEFLAAGKDVFGNTIPAGFDARELARALRQDSRRSPFTSDGRLTGTAVREAFPVSDGSAIGNPHLREFFARSGGISQWAKYSTRTHNSPYGDFQVHFYRNRITGQVYYDHDYKVVMNRRIQD